MRKYETNLKKTIIGILLAMCLVTILSACGSKSYLVEGTHFEVSGSIMTISGKGEMPDFTDFEKLLKLPWYLKGENHTISQIIIEEGIQAIGTDTFFLFRKLTDVEIADTVQSIGDYAFYNCDRLSQIRIPENLVTIGEFAFMNCESLSVITLPEGLQTIGKGCFSFCPIEEIFIPASVTDIGPSVFAGCSKLKAIHVSEDNPNYYTEDGILFERSTGTLLAYPAAKNLISYSVPEGTTTLAANAFEECGLYEIQIPDTVREIGGGCFYGSNYLKSLILPDGITKITAALFAHCENFASIYIPASVTEIESDAFYQCSSLANITLENDNPNFCMKNGILYNGTESRLICYPATIQETRFEASDNLQIIDRYAFAHNQYLREVILPYYMNSIRQGAFEGCENLKEIRLPVEVRDLDECIFTDCNSLESLALPEGIQEIELFTVYRLDNLKTIKLPSTIKSIDKDAFYACPSLTTVEFNGSEYRWNWINRDEKCLNLEEVEVIFHESN